MAIYDREKLKKKQEYTNKWKQGYRWEPKPIPCTFCGVIFIPKAANQIYCCVDCREAHTYEKTTADKFLILDRDGCKCVYCGSTPANDDIFLVLDHLIPYNEGGEHTADNLVTACNRCNGAKGANNITKETYEYIKSYILNKNKLLNIPNKKLITGSHTRNEHPRIK